MAVFRETVNLRPVDATTGAASGLLSLADRIDAFGQQALGVATAELTERATKRGQESAAAEKQVKKKGITQAPVLKEEHFIGGIEIKAHNKALRSAFLASLSNDIRENIGRLQIESPDDIIQFNEKVNGLRKGILQGVEPQFRNDVAEFFDSKATTAGLNVRGKDVARQNAEAEDQIVKSIDAASNEAFRSARNGDIESAGENTIEAFVAIDAAVDSGFIAESEAVGQKREIERETAEQSLRREFDILSDDNLKESFDLVKEKRKKVPKGWTPDEWDSYLNSQNTELNRKASGVKKDLKAAEEALQKQQSIERGLSFMDPDIPANPVKVGKGSQDRKDVNAAFNQVSQQWVGLPADQQIDNIEDFIANTGIIPDPVISKANASMRSGNTEHVIIFSKIVNDLAESQNASVLRDLPDQTRAVALQITSSVNAGLDIETATEIARKNAYGLTETDRKRIQLETQAIRPELPVILSDVLDANFDPSFIPFIEEPDVNPAIQADFNVAFESFMTLTDGDSEQSTKLASEAVVKNWGANDIDGDFRMMKFAPSVFYSVAGVDDDWMQDQFKSDLSGFGDIDNFRIGINIDSISTGQPTYPVMGLDENGIASPIFDAEGLLIEWSPDFTQTREYKEMQALPGKISKEAIELKNKADRLKRILGQDTGGFL